MFEILVGFGIPLLAYSVYLTWSVFQEARNEIRRKPSEAPDATAKYEPDPNFEDHDKSAARHTFDRSEQAIIAELRAILNVRERTIRDLREKGKRVVTDRDQWEAVAKRQQTEIARLKAGVGPTSDADGELFRELKNALARMFHPDALRSASNFERVVREELYKEINAEIGRIEEKRRSQ